LEKHGLHSNSQQLNHAIIDAVFQAEIVKSIGPQRFPTSIGKCELQRHVGVIQPTDRDIDAGTSGNSSETPISGIAKPHIVHDPQDRNETRKPVATVIEEPRGIQVD
jgi:hypothetical protein